MLWSSTSVVLQMLFQTLAAHAWWFLESLLSWQCPQWLSFLWSFIVTSRLLLEAFKSVPLLFCLLCSQKRGGQRSHGLASSLCMGRVSSFGQSQPSTTGFAVVSIHTISCFRCRWRKTSCVCQVKLSRIYLKYNKINYFSKMHGYPQFSLWIPRVLTKTYILRIVLNRAKISQY